MALVMSLIVTLWDPGIFVVVVVVAVSPLYLLHCQSSNVSPRDVMNIPVAQRHPSSLFVI